MLLPRVTGVKVSIHWMQALFKHITDVLFFNITNLRREELFFSHFASKEKGPRAAKPLVPSHTWKGLGFGSEISG